MQSDTSISESLTCAKATHFGLRMLSNDMAGLASNLSRFLPSSIVSFELRMIGSDIIDHTMMSLAVSAFCKLSNASSAKKRLLDWVALRSLGKSMSILQSAGGAGSEGEAQWAGQPG